MSPDHEPLQGDPKAFVFSTDPRQDTVSGRRRLPSNRPPEPEKDVVWWREGWGGGEGAV